jgi:hypothetical protein
MIDSGDAKDVVIKVIDTEPKNRSWVLSLVIIVILSGGNFFFYSRANKAEEDEHTVKRELAIQRSLNLTDSKDCLKAIQLAEKAKDLEWSVKFDNIQNIYNKDLKERADKLERQINLLNKRLGQ